MVLVFEDEPHVLSHIVELIQSFDIKAHGAEDVENWKTKIQNTSACICLVDVGLKKINGIELIREINRFDPKIQIICMSGYIELYQDELKEVNIYSQLSKPFSDETLHDILLGALEKFCFQNDIQTQESQRSEKRYTPKSSDEIQGQIIGEDFIEDIQVENISLRGLAFSARDEFKDYNLDGELNLIITLQGFSTYQVIGQIRHNCMGTNTYGLQFLKVQKEFRDDLKKLVASNLDESLI